MSSKTLTYNGSVNFKTGGEYYEAEVLATAYYYHQPCVMYFKDGSGQPEYDEFEIDELEVVKLQLEGEDGYVDVTDKYNSDKAFKDDIDEAIEEYLNEMDWDEWHSDEYDYDYEAEQDYYDSLRDWEDRKI